MVYGVTMATLAGDALQPEAFRVLLSADLPDGVLAEGARVLARSCGAYGMVAGQVIDLTGGEKTLAGLEHLHTLKTGRMFMGAAELGCVAAGAAQEMRDAAREYAANLGLAFQIRDDMLDVIGDEATFGKPIGSDRAEEKTTYVDLFGIGGCEEKVREYTERAKTALEGVRWQGDTQFLFALAQRLATREK